MHALDPVFRTQIPRNTECNCDCEATFYLWHIFELKSILFHKWPKLTLNFGRHFEIFYGLMKGKISPSKWLIHDINFSLISLLKCINCSCYLFCYLINFTSTILNINTHRIFLHQKSTSMMKCFKIGNILKNFLAASF